MKIPFIKDINLQHKRVFLRADLNVPLNPSTELRANGDKKDLNAPIKDGKILQDFKLQKILPTIKYIQNRGGKVILATHLGRPEAKSQTNFYDENLSTKILMPWFEEREYQIKLERDLETADIWSREDFSEILLLENLRFFNGEQGTKDEQERFAQILSNLADVYVNDAFGLIHRNDCSVTMLPKKFSASKRCFGMLIEKEIKNLDKLKKDINQPFTIVLGGNKIKDKIELLNNFLEIKEKNRPQPISIGSILIGGAIANTFLKAQGIEVGKSLIEEDALSFAKEFLQKAKEKSLNVLLPKDFLTVKELDQPKTEHTQKDSIQSDEICVDIGKETIKEFEEEIKKSKTIFTNGSMGIYANPEFATGSKKILDCIANSDAFSVAGGGDCVAAIYIFDLQDKFNFLSTGGGATLKYLACKYPLEDLKTFKVIAVE